MTDLQVGEEGVTPQSELEPRLLARWLSRLARAEPEIPGLKRSGLSGVRFPFRDREILLHGGRLMGDPTAVFSREEYANLPVYGRVVVDVGSSIGDSPLYFWLQGASKVLAFESNPFAWGLMVWNLKANHASSIEAILSRVRNLNFAVSLDAHSVLKMDCEGAEYGILGSSKGEAIRRFEHVVMEYHFGPDRIVRILNSNGFIVETQRPRRGPFGMRLGNIWARRA